MKPPRQTSEEPDMTFSLVRTDIVAGMTFSDADVRVAIALGGWSGPAADLEPLLGTGVVSCVSYSLAGDLRISAKARAVAIVLGAGTDRAGVFAIIPSEVRNIVGKTKITEAQIDLAVRLLVDLEHVRDLGGGRLQMKMTTGAWAPPDGSEPLGTKAGRVLVQKRPIDEEQEGSEYPMFRLVPIPNADRPN